MVQEHRGHDFKTPHLHILVFVLVILLSFPRSISELIGHFHFNALFDPILALWIFPLLQIDSYANVDLRMQRVLYDRPSLLYNNLNINYINVRLNNCQKLLEENLCENPKDIFNDRKHYHIALFERYKFINITSKMEPCEQLHMHTQLLNMKPCEGRN